MELVREWFRRYASNPQVVLLMLLLIVGIVAIVLIGEMVAPFIAALVLAYILDSPVVRLRSLGVNRFWAVCLVFVGFLVLFLIVVLMLLPILSQQVTQMFVELPNAFGVIQSFASQLQEAYPAVVTGSQVNQIIESVRGQVIEWGQQVLRFSVGGGISGLITIVLYLVLVPLMVFFFLKDKHKILNWCAQFLPEQRHLVETIWGDANDRIGHYMRGKIYEIIIVGVVTWVVFVIIDLKFAVLLAFLTGFSVLIPYIGAAFVGFPVALVALLQWGVSTETAIACFAYAVIQALDGNLLAPLLFSEVMKLHPIAIILALLVFGGIWGMWGLFFAIPLASLAHAIIKAWPKHKSEES